ncbi:MAG: hypothetical protein WDN08_07670 [Rhizomicrobium sp.]
MASETIRLLAGRHEIEETIQHVVWEGYDGEHHLARLELTLSSPHQTDTSRHGATTVVVHMAQKALIQLLLTLIQKSNEMGWPLEAPIESQGGFQTVVRAEMRRPPK